MVILRCTKRLGARLPGRQPWDDTRSSGRLGDWYANLLRGPGRWLALCTNEPTLLSVVLPVTPTRFFLGRFREAALHRIQQIPVPASVRREESRNFSHLSVGATNSRSVLASMTQLSWSAEAWLREWPRGDLEDLGLWLCDTPMSALETRWPWKEAVLLLTGTKPEIGQTGPSSDVR